VLGALSVTRDGRVLSLGGPRPRTVFAVLVLARGAVVTGDRLIDAVWGEEPPPSAVGALQAYVSRLRRVLEPARAAGARSGVIVREGAGYAIRLDPDEVDAWRFEALLGQAGHRGPAAPSAAERVRLLAEAFALWRGPAFAGFADEPWARTEAARLGELRELVREQLLAARLKCGEHTEALLSEAEHLVAEAPLREERWSLLALAHYRAHGRADAGPGGRQPAPRAAECVEGVGLAVRAVEGEGEETPAFLPEGVLGDQGLQFRYEDGVLAPVETGGEQPFPGQFAQSGEAGGLLARPGLVGVLRVRRAPPQREPGLQDGHGLGRSALVGEGGGGPQRLLEPPGVHRVAGQPQRVPRPLADDDAPARPRRPLRLQTAPQMGDMGL